MSFYKHYPNRKDWRKSYRGPKAFDASCQCHGDCQYCAEGRQHKRKMRELDAKEQINGAIR